MPRKGAKILKANTESLTLETKIGSDYRISIPMSIRHFVDPNEIVWVTIKKPKEEVER